MGDVGQVDGEDRTTVGIFSRDNFTALGDDETADDGKAQAETAGPGRVTALKFLKEAISHGRRQTGSAVGDGKKHLGAGEVDAGGEKNRSGGWRVVRGSTKKRDAVAAFERSRRLRAISGRRRSRYRYLSRSSSFTLLATSGSSTGKGRTSAWLRTTNSFTRTSI